MKNQRGLTVISLVCGMAVTGIFLAVISTVLQGENSEQRKRLRLASIVTSVATATDQFFNINGYWPSSQQDVQDIKLFVGGVLDSNPYHQEESVEVLIADGPNRQADSASGSIRLIVSTDKRTCLVVGYDGQGKQVNPIDLPPKL